MALALALGRRGLGRPGPIRRSARSSSRTASSSARGWTQTGGRPHAEVEALRRAKKAAQGATLYVTLEPARIRASRRLAPTPSSRPASRAWSRRWRIPIRKWPGRAMRGCATRALRSMSGFGAEEARRAHAGHITRVTKERPYVTLKLAVSADGKAGLAGRKPAAITGEAARLRVFQMRAEQRRHSGRHRHGAGRQSAIDLPAAGHGRALAGARRARRADCACRWRPRWWRRCARRRPGSSARTRPRPSPRRFCSRAAARCFASTTTTAGSISMRC